MAIVTYIMMVSLQRYMEKRVVNCLPYRRHCRDIVFFFNDTATTEIYTLSLHDALPISIAVVGAGRERGGAGHEIFTPDTPVADRKSTRLNSSHANISYAVFCLKKKKIKKSHSLTASTQSYYILISLCLQFSPCSSIEGV